MKIMNDEQTVIILESMRFILGLCDTEKQAIDNAIAITEWKQEVEALVNELYEQKESNYKLPCKVYNTLITAALCTKYGSKRFRLGEKIYYTPTEVADILKRAIEEGDL